MIKREEGFTLVELLITMVVFVLTIAAATGIFVPILTQFKQQSKIAESNIEGIIGLELLRKDIEQAGFGIPWVVPTAVSYNEAAAAPASLYNDSPSDPPRAILSGDDAGTNGSDYLVIKATSVSTSEPTVKWTYVTGTGGGGSTVHIWGNTTEDLVSGLDRVIVIIPSRGENNQKVLVNDGASFYDIFDSANFPAGFAPATSNDRYLVYGVDSVNLRMPFNRADYYISTTNVPPRCAPTTGVLMKGLINHGDGTRNPEIPLFDCVADMQIIFRSDTDDDGVIDNEASDISGLTANQIRQQLKEVRVYILAHEGQKDATYRYQSNSIYVGADETIPQALNLGRNFDLTPIADYQNYRWKIYTIVVKPDNLRG
ncbi:MAG: prepilin-type N-terminal cleavage/methylation domain-containing protein [Nitrospirae bacterium]|nr:prepilin-type N-terminal cleavage/methylation domain-containing protein [Nitrospirota bacterium]